MLKILTIIIAMVLLAWVKVPSAKQLPPVDGTPLTIDGPYVLYRVIQ
jgi:hypothetical protein